MRYSFYQVLNIPLEADTAPESNAIFFTSIDNGRVANRIYKTLKREKLLAVYIRCSNARPPI
ncbi:MAG: hypothetical protein ACL7BU_15175 [Candidatus Phlomobacter fragariae]